jgi:integration host factor subunit alpha
MRMALTKSEIVESIYNQLGFPRSQSTEAIEILLEIIKRSLEDGDDVMVSGFGKFCVRDKSQRKGRNPATGQDMMLDKRRVVTFKCSGVLKNRLNGNR